MRNFFVFSVGLRDSIFLDCAGKRAKNRRTGPREFSNAAVLWRFLGTDQDHEHE